MVCSYHLFQLAIAELVAKVPTDTNENDSKLVATSLNRR